MADWQPRGFHGSRGSRGFHGAGWNRGGFDPPGRGARYRSDPADAGNLPERLVPLSREMANLLRHNGRERGLNIQPSGWALVSSVVAALHCTEDDIWDVARESYSKDQPRFELSRHVTTDKVHIRATHKHSYRGANTVQPPPPLGSPPQPPPPLGPPPLQSQNAEDVGCKGDFRRLPDYGFAAIHKLFLEPDMLHLESGVMTPPLAEEVLAGCFLHEGEVTPTKKTSSIECMTPEKVSPRIAPVVVEDCPTAKDSSPEPAALWVRFLCAEDSGNWWWWSATQEDCFLEAAPGGWCKYAAPDSHREYWYLNDSKWFFADTGTPE